MRNEPPQQSDLPNLIETAPNDIIDEDEGIQDIEEGTFVALISNTIQDCMYFSIPSFNSGLFNHELFNHELFNHDSRVEAWG